jgi:hypothetical protein
MDGLERCSPCDGDADDLQGVKPHDRMVLNLTEWPPAQKSTYTVWGANHNWFNTAWWWADSGKCTGPEDHHLIGDSAQRIALASALAFFRGNVGAPRVPSST